MQILFSNHVSFTVCVSAWEHQIVIYVLFFLSYFQLWYSFLDTYCWRYNRLSNIFRWFDQCCMAIFCFLYLQVLVSSLGVWHLIYNTQSLVVDGVPKDGLRIQDVLVRIAVLLLVSKKVSMQFGFSGVWFFSFFFMNFKCEASHFLEKYWFFYAWCKILKDTSVKCFRELNK